MGVLFKQQTNHHFKWRNEMKTLVLVKWNDEARAHPMSRDEAALMIWANRKAKRHYVRKTPQGVSIANTYAGIELTLFTKGTQQ